MRDRWRCKMPACKGGDRRLNAHHIKLWASHPSLRFVVSNGITLCRTCHDRVQGLEEEYESVFIRVVGGPRTDAALNLMMMRYGQKLDKSKPDPDSDPSLPGLPGHP